jgi:hypothetical protein
MMVVVKINRTLILPQPFLAINLYDPLAYFAVFGGANGVCGLSGQRKADEPEAFTHKAEAN